MADAVRIAAHSKANVFLRVLAQEQSGYHTVETLLTLLDLCDTISVERTPKGIELEVEGHETGPVEENLAFRAAQQVLDAVGQKFGVRIHLKKAIPVQAGLGGGSSDGAAVLHAVNRLAGDAIPRHEILQMATRLGSDVPFFASGAPMALAWGRGERLFRIPAPKAVPVLVVIPDFGISTADAYRALSLGRSADWSRGSVVLEADAFASWGGIARLGGNDFEAVLFGRYPTLRELFERMAETRPLLVRVSGSGSAVVGFYRTERDLEGAAMQIGERHHRLIRTVTRAHAPAGPAPA